MISNYSKVENNLFTDDLADGRRLATEQFPGKLSAEQSANIESFT